MQRRIVTASAACVILLGVLAISDHVSAQQTGGSQAPTYFPYPPGVIPPELSLEIQRVATEVQALENQALADWRALPPPTVAGNPPILKDTGYKAVIILGKLMNYDQNISVNKDQACASCHMPYAAFSGPIPSVNLTMVAYPGSYHLRAGKRTAQRYTYAPFFPALQYNQEQGLFFGGNFWDSRATAYQIRNAAANQAQFPPVDPAEMGAPDTACIPYRLSQAVYRPLFEQVWGAGSFDIDWPANTDQICSTPNGAAVFGGNATPVQLSASDRTRANDDYNHWGQSLESYEESPDVSAFSSKFDAFLAGKYTFTADEAAGYSLFDGQGNCNSCHLDGRGTTLTSSNSPDNSAKAQVNPVFTCFGSANEGLPKNPKIAFYYETKPDFYGFTLNPLGFGYTDLGLGAFLRSGFGTAPNPNSDWIQYAPASDGQFQVMTARNVAMTPPQCPTTEAGTIPYFQKEFFHNGYIKSLKEMVHFYNTRDLFAYPVTSGNCPGGTTEKVNCWPMPETPANIDMTTGNLGLTDRQENQIVSFLQTLTDGFARPYPNINTFTGTCQVGGSPSTQ